MIGDCSSSIVCREVLILLGGEVRLAAVLPEMIWYVRETKEVLSGRGVSLQDCPRLHVPTHGKSALGPAYHCRGRRQPQGSSAPSEDVT